MRSVKSRRTSRNTRIRSGRRAPDKGWIWVDSGGFGWIRVDLVERVYALRGTIENISLHLRARSLLHVTPSRSRRQRAFGVCIASPWPASRRRGPPGTGWFTGHKAATGEDAGEDLPPS
eukprot:1194353-Prorocentrum_minimum.AAC.6